jgi:hypothetical protein
MPQMKPASKGKRSKKALSILGVAGLTLVVPADGSVAAMLPAGTTVTPMAEEEISDVTLATFHVYDNGTAGANRPPLLQLTYCGGCGPCAGCSGGSGGSGRCRCSGGGRCKF